jgi:uncharacterized damage-inducible protein DinB
MKDLDEIRRLLRYDRWANSAALGSLRAAKPPPPRALGWMGHIIAAEHLWLARLRQEAPTLPVWPDLSLDACADQLALLEAGWTRYLDRLSAEDLAQGVAYRNSKGEFWSNTAGDILLHVVTHSSHHRGQIASSVREGGHLPAYTDFIHAVRQGLIE